MVDQDPGLRTGEQPSDFEKLDWCLEVFGAHMTTQALGRRKPAEVFGWTVDGTIPEDVKPMLDVYYNAGREIAEADGADAARSFFENPNPYLGGKAPMDVIVPLTADNEHAASTYETADDARTVIGAAVFQLLDA